MHGLRKAAARPLAEAGCTTHEIAAITGHKTLSEVERYTPRGRTGAARPRRERKGHIGVREKGCIVNKSYQTEWLG
jgi:integrase